MSHTCKSAKQHTPYQPTDAEWACPKCGSTVNDSDGFFLDEPGEGKTDECEALHKDDVLLCWRCHHRESGATFARRCARKANKVPCPHCKGCGVVDGPPKSQAG